MNARDIVQIANRKRISKSVGIFHTNRHRGFTVVEILAVIAVIGILVSIVVVLYPTYQKRNRDNERKSDVTQLTTALSAYALQKGNYVGTGSGCGINGNGNGWLSAGPSEIAAYPKAISTCLQEAGLLRSDEFIDPLGCKWASGGVCGTSGQVSQGYMKVTCTKGVNSVTYVMAHLENEPRKDAEVDGLCDDNTVSGFTAVTQKWGSLYAMNYYVAVR
jgi:prepilin-type N-terminal cleavage/methylation domain-containing protein